MNLPENEWGEGGEEGDKETEMFFPSKIYHKEVRELYMMGVLRLQFLIDSKIWLH